MTEHQELVFVHEWRQKTFTDADKLDTYLLKYGVLTL